MTANISSDIIRSGTTLASVLAESGLDPRMIVVEQHAAILRDRTTFDSVIPEPGDTRELVHIAGDG